MSTKWKGARKERQALDAFITLSRATETVSSYQQRRLGEWGLSSTQLGILDALHHLGSMPLAEIGVKMLRSPGNMTAAVDRLEQRGLVRRERDKSDRRVVKAHLTTKGRALIAEIMPLHVKNIAKAMSVLTREEQVALTKLCKKLGLGVIDLEREEED